MEKMRIAITFRKGALWHDGTPVTPDDLPWSLIRADDPAAGNPVRFAFGKLGSFQPRNYIDPLNRESPNFSRTAGKHRDGAR